ncbi:MAG: hypothetical protein EOO02_20095, partial [Chitinophagaceae bacterium]
MKKTFLLFFASVITLASVAQSTKKQMKQLIDENMKFAAQQYKLLMKNTKYAIIPDKENPNYWILCCFEKNFKLSVHRSYAWTMDQSLYHYEFFHL